MKYRHPEDERIDVISGKRPQRDPDDYAIDFTFGEAHSMLRLRRLWHSASGGRRQLAVAAPWILATVIVIIAIVGLFSRGA
jgi:hypothetical protein